MKDCIIQKILFLINNELKICENPILPNEITDNLLVSKGMQEIFWFFFAKSRKLLI